MSDPHHELNEDLQEKLVLQRKKNLNLIWLGHSQPEEITEELWDDE